jgi:hypothetical protein
MVGFNLGARLHERLLETVRVALLFSTLLAGLSSMILLFAADPILSLFTPDPALKVVALPALRIFVSMLVLAGPSVVWINMFIGLGKGVTAMNLLLFRDALFLVPSLYLFEAGWGFGGMAFPAGGRGGGFCGDLFLVEAGNIGYRVEGDTTSAEGINRDTPASQVATGRVSVFCGEGSRYIGCTLVAAGPF